MPLTLADLRKSEKNAFTRGFMDIFLLRNKLAQFVPVQKTTTMRQRVLRYAGLPTMTWRQIGGYYAESKGTTDWAEETVYDVGDIVDTDINIARDTAALKDPRVVQNELAATSLAYEFNNVMINGAFGSDQPDGIANRVAALATGQTVAGGGVDISAATGTATTQNSFLDMLDQLMYAVDNGTEFNDVVLLVNSDALLRLWSVLRRLGLLDTTKDQFGREIRSYKGAKILDVGVKSDQTTRIIPTTSNNTTIYAVKFGEDFFSMLQYQKLDVQDLGQQPGTRNLRTEISWVFGFTMPHPRGLAQLTGVKVS